MVHLIDELKVIPGVMGACICHPHEGVQASNLPAIFKVERLETIGRQLIKMISAGRMSLDGLSDLILRFEESMVVARELKGGGVVFALCDGSCHRQILQMPLSLVADGYAGVVASLDKASPAASPIMEPGPAATAETNVSVDELIEGLQGVLAPLVGPMAGMIVEDSAETWESDGRSVTRINALVDLICQEIGDDEKADAFRQSAEHFIADLKKG